ncbi:tautomerase family protein [Ferrovibrio sp.]|uniref:tautomerase family protein n=1 Tax=Ferrovibrio sp. TaxID=1917215 RepID=UPI003D0D5274
MPMIQVSYSTPNPASDLSRWIAALSTRLAQEKLGKQPEVTAVAVQQVAAADWYIAGQSLAEAGLASFFLDIRITTGTNTKDEMAAFVAAAYAEFGTLLGPLHAESYVHVHEAQGFAYGYGGQTQERRYIAARS